MLRTLFSKGLYHKRISISKRFIAINGSTSLNIESINDPRERKAYELLNSPEPFSALPLIFEFRNEGKIIPPNIMSILYDVVKKSHNPLYTHIFANLTSVDQVGRQYFVSNVERVIRLYLSHRNWESCIAFIREVELANNGNVVLSYETLEAMLITAKWYNDIEIGMQVLQVINDAYPSVYARTWGLVTQLSLDTKDYESLKWIYKNALVPGLLVLDDSSYLRMASIASENGDLHMCEWSSLRMRRRQRALHTDDTSSLQLYIYLIEAAACSSIINKEDKLAASFQAVCRYLIRLGPLAGQVSVLDLPQTVDALIQSQENNNMLKTMFEHMKLDAAVSSEAKAIVFNLLLYAEMGKGTSTELMLDHAYSARSSGIEFNEDSVLCLMELLDKENSSVEAIQTLAKQCPTRKVLKRAKMLVADRSSAS